MGPVERLDPEPVTCEHRAAAARRPRPRARTFPRSRSTKRVAVLLVEVREDLGVAAASNRWPSRQLRAQRAWLYSSPFCMPTSSVLGEKRLVATLDIDDRQPPHPKRDPGPQRAPIIRPAMRHRVRHRIQHPRLHHLPRHPTTCTTPQIPHIPNDPSGAAAQRQRSDRNGTGSGLGIVPVLSGGQ